MSDFIFSRTSEEFAARWNIEKTPLPNAEGRPHVKLYKGFAAVGASVAPGTVVAVKRCDKLRVSPKERLQDRQEAMQYSRVRGATDHPAICRLYDWFEGPRYIYLVLEFVEGEDLCIAIQRQGAHPEDAARPIIRQLVSALQELHASNIAHRDLKPENIMLMEDLKTIKVIDFGNAKAGVTGFIRSETILGTPPYSPPWQMGGKEYSGSAADMFSVGSILFTLLSGCHFANKTSMDYESVNLQVSHFNTQVVALAKFSHCGHSSPSQLLLIGAMVYLQLPRILSESRMLFASNAMNAVPSAFFLNPAVQHAPSLPLPYPVKIQAGCEGSKTMPHMCRGTISSAPAGGMKGERGKCVLYDH